MPLDRSNEGWTALLGKDVVGPDGKTFPTRGKIQFKKSGAISDVEIEDDEANGQTVVTFPTTAETAVFGGLVAAARASVPDLADDEIIFLSGYTTPGDGGEGYFRKSPNDAVDDGGTILNEGGEGSTQPGLRRIYSGPLDVRWFGADATGMADSAPAVQRAIDVSVEGDTLYFPRGSYKLLSALTLKCNLWLKGDGQAQISGTADPATTIVDGRTNPSTPLLDFRKDSTEVYTITNTTNANPIVVTVTQRHRLKDGYSVVVAGVTGNTNANGTKIATRIDEHRFSINAAGNGAHGGTATATSPVLPQTRGCLIECIFFYFPSATKTGYSVQLGDESLVGAGGTAGIRFRFCNFRGPLSSTGDPTSVYGVPGVGDPGMIRLGRFEGVSFIDCTFHGGTKHLSFLGAGPGGPFLAERCWFYDCNHNAVDYDNGADHDHHYIACNVDPLYRTTPVGAGFNIKCNGFTVRGCGFYGTRETQPTAAVLVVEGTGVVEDCNIATTSEGIDATSATVRLAGNTVHAYCPINLRGGNISFHGPNRFVPDLVPDNTVGGNYPFERKRAIIVNEPYAGLCAIDACPQTFEAVTGSPLEIEEATNASPSVIKITDHGLSLNDWVLVVSATGNTAINGIRQVVPIDDDHFTLKDKNGTAINGNGAYDAGSADAYPRWFFANSFFVGGSPWMYVGSATAAQQFTSGKIRYTRNLDFSSADGGETSMNVQCGAMVALDITDPRILPTGTGTQLRDCDQAPCIITNEGFNGDVEYKLGPLHPGRKFRFMKRPNNAAQERSPKMTITADFGTSRTVSSVTGNGVAPIKVTTTANHGYVDRQRCRITGVTTNDHANGGGYLTVKDADEFYLNGSSGIGAGGASGGTITVQDLIYIPGSKDGTGSIKNADEREFNAITEIEGAYLHNTPTGEEYLRWLVHDPLGSWAAADGSGGFQPLSGKRVYNADLGDSAVHVIGTLNIPYDAIVYVSAITQMNKNDGTFWHAKRGAVLKRVSGTLSLVDTVDTLGNDHPATPPAGSPAVDITVSGDDVEFKTQWADDVSVQVTLQWEIKPLAA